MTTANIGSHALVRPGECVIGRLVPTVTGPMFESVPLVVPDHVAAEVARDPAGWLDALARAQARVVTSGFTFGLVTDVPPTIAMAAVMADGPARPVVAPSDDAELAAATWELARRCATRPPAQDPGEVDVWACLAAALLEPGVAEALPAVLRRDDASVLVALSRIMAEPAASVCADLERQLRRAASGDPRH